MTSPHQPTGQESIDRVVLPLATEDIRITKRVVPSAVVEVKTVTDERPEQVDVALAVERVEITRVPVDRIVESAPPIEERDDLTIIPVIEEIIVIERRLRVKEEIHLRRIRSTVHHQETVTLRVQTAVVSRSPIETPDGNDQSGPPADTTRPGTEQGAHDD